MQLCIPLQGLGSPLPSPCGGKVLAVTEAVLSLAHWALCVTRSGVISTIYVRNSLGLLPVLMSKRSTSQSNAVLGKHTVTGWTPSLKGCGIPPTFPRDPFFSCPPWLSPCPGPAAHQRVCPLLLSNPDALPAWPVCAGATTHPGSTTASVLVPHAGQSKPPGLYSDCFGLTRQAAMDGCWGMRDASRKNASRGDLVLQPPGRVALLSWACVPGCAAKLTAVHWQAVLYKISQPTTVQHNQVISSS